MTILRMLSPDGKTLGSVGDDAIRLWDMRTGRSAGGIAGLGIASEHLLGAVPEDLPLGSGHES
jgi:hypothetical protein